MPNGTTSDMIGSLVDVVQKVGFPIVMVFILSYVIYKQNDTLVKINTQQAANMVAFQSRMEAQDKAMNELRDAVRYSCGSAPSPAKP